MSIYDTIETAVTAAENMVKNGSDINDAVAKASAGLNQETVKRVVENVNVNAFCKLLKSGEDRTKEFPVADAKLVLEKLGDTVVNDLDLNKTTVPDMSYYKEPAAKTASMHRFDKSIPKHQMDMYKLAHRNLAKRQAELYRDAINDCRDVVVDNMYKIASCITGNQAKADELFGNVKLKYGKKFDFLIDNICKNARVKCGSYKRGIFDDTNANVQMFDQLVDALEKQSLLKKKAQIVKTSGIVSDYTYDADYPEEPLVGPSRPGKEELAWIKWQKEQDKEQKAKELEDASKPTGFQKNLELVNKSLTDVEKTWFDRFSKFRAKVKSPVLGPVISSFIGSLKETGKKRYEELEKELKESGKISDKFEEVLKQRDIFTEMLHDDPVISQQNPKVVSGLYKQIAKIAPKVSTQKEIVRSILRMLTSQTEPLLDAVTAKEIVKLELALAGKTDEEL